MAQKIEQQGSIKSWIDFFQILWSHGTHGQLGQIHQGIVVQVLSHRIVSHDVIARCHMEPAQDLDFFQRGQVGAEMTGMTGSFKMYLTGYINLFDFLEDKSSNMLFYCLGSDKHGDLAHI